ncbi:MAG: bifunctional precorrin-2 dehydrogenase/sirohydrochlorin ferrochelatase [Candidatus Hinthialibacter antarcticus]|nr:bifunctional precorrin-2 dehydrogenase/sirohydrochlorin ferrochelatase [Candidatus Hinthialibacter antarcticus]
MSENESQYTSYYTVCMNVKDRKCVVVGGGDVARRKAASLSDCGAVLTVISPKLDPVLEYMAFQKEITWVQRDFEDSDLDGAFLAVAATDKRELNQKIGALCREQNILVNVVDGPDESDFINPTVVERGPLTIAISTCGLSPSLAASIRQELEMVYGDEYGSFLEMMAKYRPMVLNEFTNPQQRAKILERMVSSRALSLIRSGMSQEADRELEKIVNEARRDKDTSLGSLPIANS